jgi:hypothetical protein
MPKKTKKDVSSVLNKLDKILEKNKITEKIEDTMPSQSSKPSFDRDALNQAMLRGIEITKSMELLKNLKRYSYAILGTCDLRLSDGNVELMMSMLSIMLSKLEQDKLIKINV